MRSAGQVPLFYSHRPSGARSFPYGPYVDESNQPLFPVGFGLSYTSFEFSDLVVTPESTTSDGKVEISVRVANIGERSGDEVVQLYTRTDGATVTRPVKELRGFKRITLAAGESKRVRFTLPVAQMAYYNGEMTLGVEPAHVTVMVGNSSQDIALQAVVQITGEASRLEQRTVFFSESDVS